MVDTCKPRALAEGIFVRLEYVLQVLITIQSVELELTEITDASQVPLAVHGTDNAAWNIIGT